VTIFQEKIADCALPLEYFLLSYSAGLLWRDESIAGLLGPDKQQNNCSPDIFRSRESQPGFPVLADSEGETICGFAA